MRSSKISTSTDTRKRRKSSIDILLGTANHSHEMSAQSSTLKGYKRFKTPQERVVVASRTYRHEILCKYGEWQSKLEFSRNTVRDFMKAQQDIGLLDEKISLVYRRIAFLHGEEKAEYDPQG